MKKKVIIFFCLIVALFCSSCSGNNATKLNSRVSAVATLLSEDNIAQLESACMVREFIFPFDFLQEPFPTSGSEWTQLIKDVELATGERTPTLYERISGAIPEGATPLAPGVQANWEFYQKLYEKGVDLADFDTFYLLIIVNASAGFDLKDLEINGNQIDLPDVKILDLNVTTKIREGWPNISGMTPALLNDIIKFVEPLVEEELEKSELLNMAEEQGRMLINNFFTNLDGEIIIN